MKDHINRNVPPVKPKRNFSAFAVNEAWETYSRNPADKDAEANLLANLKYPASTGQHDAVAQAALQIMKKSRAGSSVRRVAGEVALHHAEVLADYGVHEKAADYAESVMILADQYTGGEMDMGLLQLSAKAESKLNLWDEPATEFTPAPVKPMTVFKIPPAKPTGAK